MDRTFTEFGNDITITSGQLDPEATQVPRTCRQLSVFLDDERISSVVRYYGNQFDEERLCLIMLWFRIYYRNTFNRSTFSRLLQRLFKLRSIL